jgi:hypothetical protein
MSETNYQNIAPKFLSPVPGATVTLDTANCVNFKWTPGETENVAASTPGFPGQQMTVMIDTVGTTSYTLTFTTNFRTTATLASGTTAARRFVVTFVSDGLVWTEQARTAAQA